MNKLIVNLSLIVSIDTFICVFRLGGYCRNSCSGDYEYDGRELRDGKCGHSAKTCCLSAAQTGSNQAVSPDGGSNIVIGAAASGYASSFTSGCTSTESGAYSECTASSNQSWVSGLYVEESGLMNLASVIANVSANTSTSSRSATITVRNACGKSASFTYTQNGRCDLSVSAIHLSFSATDLAKSVTVDSSTGQFSTSVSDSWIVISNSTSTGFNVGVQRNTTGIMRSGSVTVQNSCGESKSITISQAAASTPEPSEDTGNVSLTLDVIATRCCNNAQPIMATGYLTLTTREGLSGKSYKLSFSSMALNIAHKFSEDVLTGSYDVSIQVTSVSCRGTTLATGFKAVDVGVGIITVNKNVTTNVNETVTSECN